MKTINELLLMSQTELYDYIVSVCIASRLEYEIDKRYITLNSISDKPMLCVHLDTINTSSNIVLQPWEVITGHTTIQLNPSSKAKCLGGDDRCGVWIALQLIEDIASGKLLADSYSFGFFCDEETGGHGSAMFSEQTPVFPTALIGLDRRNKTMGVAEVATYGYDNDKLIAIATNYGYSEQYGSFTDASNIAGESSVACINLSIGYNMEHTSKEYIGIDDMLYTLQFLRGIPFGNTLFEHEAVPCTYRWGYEEPKYKRECVCDWCGEHKPLFWHYSYDEQLMLCDECIAFEENGYDERYLGYSANTAF